MKFRILDLFLVAGLSLSPLLASAHGRWIVPSHTILSGAQAEVVTFDMSVSNDFFHPDFAYGGTPVEELFLPENKKPSVNSSEPRAAIITELMGSTQLEVTTPAGVKNLDSPLVNFGRKTVASVLLDESGTYRFGIKQNPIYFTFYKDENGKRGREFGTPAMVKTFLPKNASEISGTKLINRVETYVTRNDLSQSAITPTGKGLELEFISHPNELFVGEPGKFVLLHNGKPVKRSAVVLTFHNTRFRNDRNPIRLITASDGGVSVVWLQPGLYLLEAELEMPSKEQGIHMETFGLYVTLEVNPE